MDLEEKMVRMFLPPVMIFVRATLTSLYKLEDSVSAETITGQKPNMYKNPMENAVVLAVKEGSGEIQFSKDALTKVRNFLFRNQMGKRCIIIVHKYFSINLNFSKILRYCTGSLGRAKSPIIVLIATTYHQMLHT